MKQHTKQTDRFRPTPEIPFSAARPIQKLRVVEKSFRRAKKK
jgi:hypothetical protein